MIELSNPKKVQEFKVFFLDEVNSTNDLMLEMAAQDAEDRSVLIARNQTAGRGRNTRTWLSREGQSLTFTVLFKPESSFKDFLLRFTALASLAVVDYLAERFQLEAKVKWPNDVLVNGKKICGILTEASFLGSEPSAVVVGVGFNLGRSAHASSEKLRWPATSIEEETGELPLPHEMLEGLLKTINKYYMMIKSPSFLEAWNEHLAFRGEYREIINEKGETESIRLIKINPDGSLLVENLAKTQRVLYSEELSG